MSEMFLRSEDAGMIAESARRWIESEYRADDSGHSVDNWAAMAELGWHAIALPEDLGGLGLPAGATLALAEECGRGLVTEPVVEAALVAATLAGTVLDTAALDGLAEGLVTGSRIAMVLGLGAPFEPGADGTLTGVARHVPGGAQVTDYLVLARQAGGELALFALEGQVERRVYRSVDGRALADIILTATPATRIADGEGLRTTAARTQSLRRAALAAETVGAMERAIEVTSGYLQERTQFGQPLARFQALRHRMADMHADAELARTMAAMLVAPDGTPAEAGLADRALAQITTAARTIGERAIQLHGGMGMTQEMAIGGYFKRLLYLSIALGGETAPRSRIASALVAEPEYERKSS
ncbi:acyl-CoA dehydrogenase family protein [Nitratireductor alexandrii]|uniref:acyl-CoA dehydrogenase family protein n=1 Tax=Nitratireductor alexandrii TaxID=2448161 RepID=UPI000FD7BF9A|nr:acyl-CoA dehydrogenase family protein [Nitratireductor alexandrii]